MYKDTDDALKELLPFVVDRTNSLWDGGLIFISKDENDNYQVELTGYYYESEKDKESLNSYEREREIHFNPIHKSVYDYLQRYFIEINPKVKWNRLALEVKTDGKYIPHYEFNEEEVSPNAPPAPDIMTADYLCVNLRNCLAYNAPDDYQWIWEVLEREKTNDGKIEIGGKFYYSTKEDKSDPQELQPGEFIYMCNVSMRLFDEFLSEKTKGWSEIRLDFSRQGDVHYYLLKRDL